MTEPLLDIDGLTIVFPGGRGQLPWQRRPDVRAVQGASLTVGVGETVGLVGESGSGKTTLGRAVLRFLTPADGTIRLGDFDVTGFGRSVPAAYRNAVQVVFQDPVGSLNPSMVVADIIGEPLTLHERLKGEPRRQRAAELLEQVGLRAEHLDRYPHEFSGGQRQRIAIARALATSPDLIVLDEPVSALDVSTQSQVINLLEQLQRDTATAYLFIAHDLAVVRHACERIAVMYHSRIVETAPADAICEQPHPPLHRVAAGIDSGPGSRCAASQVRASSQPHARGHGRDRRGTDRQLSVRRPVPTRDGHLPRVVSRRGCHDDGRDCRLPSAYVWAATRRPAPRRTHR